MKIGLHALALVVNGIDLGATAVLFSATAFSHEQQGGDQTCANQKPFPESIRDGVTKRLSASYAVAAESARERTNFPP